MLNTCLKVWYETITRNWVILKKLLIHLYSYSLEISQVYTLFVIFNILTAINLIPILKYFYTYLSNKIHYNFEKLNS